MKIRGMHITVPNMRQVLGLRGHEPSKFNRCVGAQLYGTHPANKAKARENFTAAVKECKGTKG